MDLSMWWWEWWGTGSVLERDKKCVWQGRADTAGDKERKAERAGKRKAVNYCCVWTFSLSNFFPFSLFRFVIRRDQRTKGEEINSLIEFGIRMKIRWRIEEREKRKTEKRERENDRADERENLVRQSRYLRPRSGWLHRPCWLSLS